MKRFAFRPYLLIVWALFVMITSATATADLIDIIFLGIVGILIIFPLSFFWPARWRIRYQLFNSWAAIPLAFIVIASVAITEWPLRLNYMLARPSMNAIAARVQKGHKVKTPIQLGLFRIKKVELRNGIVCLWTTTDTGGDSGLVNTTPQGSHSFNLWSTLRLDNDWQYIEED